MSKLRTLTTGHRKMIVFFGTAAFLLAGLALCLSNPAGLGLYGIFAPALATATGIFTWGNAKEQEKQP